MEHQFAILSSPLLLEEGVFECSKISKEEAQLWVDRLLENNENLEIFCGHETVKILGLDPDKDRKECQGYTQALCLKPLSRLEFGREYSAEEVEQIGVEFTLITKHWDSWEDMKAYPA